VIESRSPGADTVVVVEDSLAEFSVYAVDEDGDPIVYSLVVGDSVWAENETGTFEIVFPEPETLNVAVFARDLIQFADSTSWVVIVQNQAVVRGNSGTPPADFGLSAYPNPFNSRTVLSFELRAARKVELAVYDIMGREVAVLANGYRDAGNYEIDFDGTNLPSGLYFARLTAGDFRTSQKLLLIK